MFETPSHYFYKIVTFYKTIQLSRQQIYHHLLDEKCDFGPEMMPDDVCAVHSDHLLMTFTSFKSERNLKMDDFTQTMIKL